MDNKGRSASDADNNSTLEASVQSLPQQESVHSSIAGLDTQPTSSAHGKAGHSRVTIQPPADYFAGSEGFAETSRHPGLSRGATERRDQRPLNVNMASESRPAAPRPATSRRISIQRRPTYSVDHDENELLEDQRWNRPQPNIRTMSTGHTIQRRGGSAMRRRATTAVPAVLAETSEGEEQNIFSPSRLHAEPVSEDEDEDEGLGQEESGFTSDDAEDAEQTLKARQEAINETHPFGVKIWKSSLYKKDRSVQRMAEAEIHSSPGAHAGALAQIGNILWTLIFGWWLAIVAFVGALLCFLTFTCSGREYGKALWGLTKYAFYPFGRYLQLQQDDHYLEEDEGEGRNILEYEQWQAGDLEEGRLFFGPRTPRTLVGRGRDSLDNISEVDSLHGANERTGLITNSEEDDRPETARRRRFFGRGEWNIGRVIFYVYYYIVIAPLLVFTSAMCWLMVFTIPMARVSAILLDHLRRHPLALSFHSSDTHHLRSDNSAPVLVCTYRALGWKYYKYTIDGTNIIIINLMAVVLFVVFDYWVLVGLFQHDSFLTSPATLFTLALFSIIPLAYFIGLAVASVSAQSSMGLASVLNAFFSTIVEVFLYCVALSQGKSRLVEGSIVGSILAGILLMPGLSMCAGTVYRKTQLFNAQSAEATMTMLLFAVIGAFAPTLFYQIYGTYELKCRECDTEATGSRIEDCRRCYFSQPPSIDDPFYAKAVRPFCYLASVLLVISYIIGCLFTLKTHAQLIWQQPQPVSEPKSTRPPSRAGSVKFGDAGRLNGGTSIRESPIYKRVLGQSLTSAGLVRLPSSLNTSQNTTTPHIIPPPDVTDMRVVNDTPHLPHQKPLASLSTEENESLVRGVAEMVAVAATASLNAALTESVHHETPKKPARVSDAALQAIPAQNQVEHAGGGGHDAPNWSRLKSMVILCGATVLYAAVAEILVSTVDVVLEGVNIDEKLLGITLFALVPNTTEFLNAISFAMNGNVALSMEIGSAYALQVCLLQMPALVLFTAWTVGHFPSADRYSHMFTLIFPQWDMVTIILCVLILTNIVHEGKSNYFKGSFLILSYLTVMLGFYFSGYTDAGDGIDQKAQMFDAMSRKTSYFVGNKYGHPSNGAGFVVQ